jgi:hypothetical protein
LALALVCLGPLQAQSPNVGFSFSMGLPSGRFAETKYNEVIEDLPAVATEGYYFGYGVQLTVSLPLQKSFAFRPGFAVMSSRGKSRAAGYETIFLRHTLINLSGEFQVFFGDAHKHKGTYAITGISGDFERFERSHYDLWDSDNYNHSSSYGVDGNFYSSSKLKPEVDVARKSRLRPGYIVGLGHAFEGDIIKFTTEVAYHTSLTDKDLVRSELVAADFVRVSFGFLF